jgi:predicted benzoate:H+ symporter BenE
MICCILSLLVAGPLGILLAPIWAPRRDLVQAEVVCRPPRRELWRAAAMLVAFLLLAGLFATILHFLDPPMFNRFCTLRVFR